MEEQKLKSWFCQEVLPLEAPLTRFIRVNVPFGQDVADIRQEIYERALNGAGHGLPIQTRAYLFAIARNHLINLARRRRVVSMELIADLEHAAVPEPTGGFELQLSAREELRRAEAGLKQLPPRCRTVVWLRKVEGLSTRETAERLGVTTHTIEKHLTEGMRALTEYVLSADRTGQAKVVRWKAKDA